MFQPENRTRTIKRFPVLGTGCLVLLVLCHLVTFSADSNVAEDNVVRDVAVSDQANRLAGTGKEEANGVAPVAGMPLPKDAKPMPLPIWKPPIQKAGGENSLVVKDIRTGEVKLLGPPSMLEFGESGRIDGGPGDLSSISPELLNSDLKNFTDLELIASPNVYPWRVNCKLWMLFPSGWWVGSGVLIDSKHVLTAGHVVYNDDDNAWASQIIVVPGYENGNEPYERAYATQLYSWTGWTVNESRDWDMGYMVLDRPVGSLTGWHGYGYNDDNAFFTGNTFNDPGYPAETPYNGEEMWYWYGTYDNVNTHIAYFTKYGFQGMSGSGSYDIDGSNRYVYLEMSHRRNDIFTLFQWWTGHVRINSDRFSSIGSEISNNTPGQFDLVALDVNAAPTTITAGTRLSTFNYYVHNYSSVSWGGNVSVDVYLSTDATISTGDRLIQTRSFTETFNPKSSWRLNAVSSLPLIPSDLSGNYYIGIILDISDFNSANNTSSTLDVTAIHINPQPVPVVSSFSINNGADSCTRSVTLPNSCSNSPTHYMACENSDFSGCSWQSYSSAPAFTLSSGCGTKTVYFKVKNGSGESNVASDQIRLNWPPTLINYAINNGDSSTCSRTVTLNNSFSPNCAPTEYMACEDPNFSECSWQPYSTAPSFTLSPGNGLKTVFFKTRRGCAESNDFSDQINLVSPPGTPVISGLPDTICGGQSVNLSATSTGSTNWNWTSPCGTFSNPDSSTTSWTPPNNCGSCQITVTASNSCDSVASSRNTFLGQKPDSVTIAGAASTCGEPIQLTGSASCNPDSWNWSSNCGTFDPVNGNPTTWTPPPEFSGSCEITLTPANSCGSAVTPGTKNISVGQQVVSSFFPDKDTAFVGDTICFTDVSTGGPNSWYWDFGDGQNSSLPNPCHSYSSAGVYDVCLTVSNSCNTDISCKTIRIEQPDTLIADFEYFFHGQFHYTFRDLTIRGSKISVTEPMTWMWNWDFGDGDTDIVQNPEHTYPTYGQYTVCLIVYDQSDADTICKQIYVPLDSVYSISGTILYCDSVKTVPGASVDLINGVFLDTVTDPVGAYLFGNLTNGSYTVTPNKNTSDLSVNVGDIIKIRRHIAQLEIFNMPCKYLAADFDTNCLINIGDVIKLRRCLAELDTAGCDRWRFVDGQYPLNSGNWCSAPGSAQVVLSGADLSNVDFIGVKIGDVNNTWQQAGYSSDLIASETAGDAMALELVSVSGVSLDTLSMAIELLGEGTLAGLELHLEYDAPTVRFIGLKSDILNSPTVNDVGGKVHIVWEDIFGTIKFSGQRTIGFLQFLVGEDLRDSTAVEIRNMILADEMGDSYQATGTGGMIYHSFATGSGPAGDKGLPDKFVLQQNYPNPFNPETSIRFGLPKTSHVQLSVYNLLGMKVSVIAKGVYTAGYHTVYWNGRNDGGVAMSSGLYLYRLETDETVSSRKMLLVK